MASSKSLGTLTLDLVAKTGGFVAGMDKAERSSAKWRKKVERDVRSAGKALGAGLAAGAAAAAAGLTLIVRESAASEKAIAQLDARLKSTGAASGKTAEELKALAGSLQNTTAFSDEAIIEMETLLLKFTNISGEIFDNTVPAVLDMAAALGKDLPAAAQLMGRALNDPIKGMAALAKSGVKFSEEQKDVIKQLVETGRTAEAQAIILQGFNTQFGGSAVAAADTFFGAMKQAQNAFGELLEAPGGLNDGKEAIQELTAILKDPATVQAAAKLTNALISGFGNAAKAIRDTVNVMGFLGESLASAVGGPAADDMDRIAARIEHLKTQTAAYASEGERVAPVVQTMRDELKKLETVYALNLELINSSTAATAALGKEQDKLGPITVTAMRRLPVGRSKEEIEAQKQAQREAESAAKSAIKAAEQHAKAIADQVTALQFQAENAGKTADEMKLLELAVDGATPAQLELAEAALKTVSAYEANTKAQQDYQSLIQDLRTDEERLTDQLNERLAVLKAIVDVPAEDREQAKSRIAAAAFADAPDYAGLAPEVGGALGESFKLADAQKELEDWYATQLEMLQEYRTEHAELSAQWNEQEQSLAQEHADRLAEIDQARALVAYSAMEETFGSLSGLARQFAGEQSDAYKVLFAAEKAAAIARSIVAIQTALAQASASAPFPANLAAMATVAAQTASIISTISSVAIGQAHDGLMSVPKTGTYLLEKGERVTTAETSAKLDNTLDQARNSINKNPAGGTNLRIVNAFDTAVIGDYLGSSNGEQLIMNTVKRNQRTIQSMSR